VPWPRLQWMRRSAATSEQERGWRGGRAVLYVVAGGRMMAVMEKELGAGAKGHLFLKGHFARLQPLLPSPLSCPALLHLLLAAAPAAAGPHCRYPI
jgi:hypothetical protein